MPMYQCVCACGASATVYRRVSERNNDLPHHCATPMQRVIVAPAVQAGFEPFESPKTGKWIESREALREDLRASGSFLLEPGVRADIARRRKESEAKVDALVEQRTNETIRDLSACGRI